MVYEDVHWSDPSTRQSLEQLIDRVPALRVLMILTFRPEFTSPWIGRPHVTMLTLNRLRRRQGAEIVAYVTGGKALPKEISDQIVNRTDGVPLFIEELTKTVVESGIVTEAGDHYALAGPMAQLAIPTSLHSSLLARLDRLAPTREVAQIGAALGRSFSYELISAVAGMPQQKLDEALHQLVSAELIFRRGVPPDAEYTFKHALVQDAAYTTMLRDKRRQLHGRIAATLEAHFSDIVKTQPALLAQHCTEAGLAKKAVGYRLKAGQQALLRSAMMEAVAQSQNGLELLAGLPDGPWRQQQELDLQITLGPALGATKGYPAMGATIARARSLAEQIDQPEYLAPLLYGQWQYHLVRAEYKLALSLAEQLEKIGQARNDVTAQLMSRHATGLIHLFLGELVAARAVMERCREFADPACRPVNVGMNEDPYVATLGNLAVTLELLGCLDQARLELSKAISEARRLGHALTLAIVLSFAGWHDWLTSSPEFKQHVEELLAVSNEHGFPFYSGLALVSHGSLLTELGQAQEALTPTARGMTQLRSAGVPGNQPFGLAVLAKAYGMLGRPAEGLNCLTEAAQFIEQTEERVGEADVYRLRGDLLKATGDQITAEQSYHQALGVARRQSAKFWNSAPR